MAQQKGKKVSTIRRRRERKNIESGAVHIQSTFNNTGVNPDVRVKDLAEEDLAKLRDYIDANYTVEGDLRREVALNIKRLVEIQCYRGVRHRKGLPVRGQSSKTNARTRKGPRRTVAKKKTATR